MPGGHQELSDGLIVHGGSVNRGKPEGVSALARHNPQVLLDWPRRCRQAG